MDKITYKELRQIFTEFNQKNHPERGRITGENLTGVVVITEGSFSKEYSKESRSYEVSSDNKAFRPNLCGYSIYASAIDGSDDNVRLEAYLAEEQGGEDGWKVDYCYLL